VEDHGIGLDSQHLESILTFPNDEQEIVARQTFGLFLVKNIVNAMNGNVFASSKQKDKTVFSLFILIHNDNLISSSLLQSRKELKIKNKVDHNIHLPEIKPKTVKDIEKINFLTNAKIDSNHNKSKFGLGMVGVKNKLGLNRNSDLNKGSIKENNNVNLKSKIITNQKNSSNSNSSTNQDPNKVFPLILKKSDSRNSEADEHKCNEVVIYESNVAIMNEFK